jgi:hypothetical protein
VKHICAVVFVLFSGALSPAAAQFARTDGVAKILAAVSGKCLQVPRQLAKEAEALGKCEIACRGCGCQGGPGYRLRSVPGQPAGTCVGFSNINSKCGEPPHKKCAKECVSVHAGCALFGRVKLLAQQKRIKSKLRWVTVDSDEPVVIENEDDMDPGAAEPEPKLVFPVPD